MLRRFAPALICLLAFALAAVGLSSRSLWGDEAFSVWASKQPATLLMAGLDAQPPLHHLILKWGRALWGESVFAIRFASLCCGVLCVPIAWRAAAWLLNPRAALVCALVLSMSPMLLYYDQEARMYAPAALFSSAAIALTARGLRGNLPLRAWLGYVLATLAALFTHFYTLPVLLVNTVALLFGGRSARERLGQWTLAHGAIALLFGAWFFGLQWRVLTRSAATRNNLWPPISEVLENIQRGASGLFFGLRFAEWQALPALALCAAALLGALPLWRAGRRAAALTGLGWCGLSFAFVFATASRSGIVPDFSPRYLLFALLPMMLLASAWALRPGALWVIAAVLALAPTLAGQRDLRDPAWVKSRYDELLSQLRSRARPDDLTVLLNSDQFPLLDYYGPTGTRVWIMDNSLWSDARQPEAAAQFAEARGDAPRVWLLKYGWAGTPGLRSSMEAQLASDGVRLYAGEFGDATLALFERIDSAAERPVQAADVSFGGQIRLTGWRARGAVFDAGDAVPIDLIWRADAPPAADYTVFVHLRRAADGVQVNALDSAPAPATASWQAGQVVTDTRAIQVPADAAPGTYRIIIGLYQYPSFERLRIGNTDATEFAVTEIEVTK